MRFELPDKPGPGTALLVNMYEEVPDTRAIDTLRTGAGIIALTL